MRTGAIRLKTRTIGEGARLMVDEAGPSFTRWKPFPSPAVSPPIRQAEQGGGISIPEPADAAP
jgi:hypothetical protein